MELHEIHVLEVGKRAELALEPIETLRRQVPQGLERDQALAVRVVGFIDNAKPSLAKGATD